MAAGVGGNLLLVGFLVLMARRGSLKGAIKKDSGQQDDSRKGGSFRAAVLAVAAGSAFGLTAALTSRLSIVGIGLAVVAALVISAVTWTGDTVLGLKRKD